MLHPMKMYFGKLLSVVIMIVYVGPVSVGAQVTSKLYIKIVTRPANKLALKI